MVLKESNSEGISVRSIIGGVTVGVGEIGVLHPAIMRMKINKKRSNLQSFKRNTYLVRLRKKIIL